MKKPTLFTCRRTVQISVAVAFIIIPWLNHMRISIVYGNFLSFHFFKFPLADPLAVLQVTLKNTYLSAELLIGAGIALALAATLGTVFCSWICPYGLLSEWAHALSRHLPKERETRPVNFHRWGFRVKITLFFIGLSAFFLFTTTPALNQLSLPAWYSRIFQFWFEQRHICLAIFALLAILNIETVAGKRLWCRYICPQSVLISLAKQLNPHCMRVHFNSKKCICKGKHQDPCAMACSLNLDPKKLKILPEIECTNCGDCVVACHNRGRALAFQFDRANHRSPNNDV